MADYASTSETINPTQNDVAVTAGQGSGALELRMTPLLSRIAGHSFVVSGMNISTATSTSLVVPVSAGSAVIEGYSVETTGATNVTCVASVDNYIFGVLTRDGAGLATGLTFRNSTSTSGAAIADSVPLGLAVAAASTFTSLTDLRPTKPSGPLILGRAPTNTTNNSTSLTSLGKVMIPGGLLGTNGRIRLALNGLQDNSVAGIAQSHTLTVRLNGTTVGALTASIPAGEAEPARFEIDLIAEGATNAQRIFGVRHVKNGTTSTDNGINASAAIDMTLNQILEVFANWETAGGPPTFTSYHWDAHLL